MITLGRLNVVFSLTKYLGAQMKDFNIIHINSDNA